MNHKRKIEDFNPNELIAAAKENQAELVQHLITSGVDVNSTDTQEQKTALHWFAYHGDLDMVEFLIKQVADLNKKDKFGWTPLMYAVLNKKFKVIKI